MLRRLARLLAAFFIFIVVVVFATLLVSFVRHVDVTVVLHLGQIDVSFVVVVVIRLFLQTVLQRLLLSGVGERLNSASFAVITSVTRCIRVAFKLVLVTHRTVVRATGIGVVILVFRCVTDDVESILPTLQGVAERAMRIGILSLLFLRRRLVLLLVTTGAAAHRGNHAFSPARARAGTFSIRARAGNIRRRLRRR